MKPEDEAISAWLDGGLDNDGAARMNSLASEEEVVAQRAARFRHLDDLVRGAVPHDEDVPHALLERLGLAEPVDAEIVDLAAARAARVVRVPAATVRRSPIASGGWRIAAQVVMVLGIGLAGVVWLGTGNNQSREPKAEYTALGDKPSPANALAAQANALVMFNPGVDAAEARAIVGQLGARIVAGPTATGGWRLGIDPAHRDEVLTRLRARSEVRMAEPIDGTAP